MTVLKIGARGSALSIAQTGMVAKAIEKANPGLKTEIMPIKTTGDKMAHAQLSAIGGKGLFVKEIEEALLAGEIDLAVHSAKDLPSELPEGLIIGALPERADWRDVLVARNGEDLDSLPQGAVVGTSGLRRRSQLLARRPDLKIEPIRGNVNTRLNKVQTEVYATLLAGAGLARLGIKPERSVFLDQETMLPAAGQGTLALESRSSDQEVRELIAPLEHPPTILALSAERGFLSCLGSGCQLPVAVLAQWEGGIMTIEGLIASLDGSQIVRNQKKIELATPEAAANCGKLLATELLAAGGEEIMKGIGI